jgi:hypothetical protein
LHLLEPQVQKSMKIDFHADDWPCCSLNRHWSWGGRKSSLVIITFLSGR